MRQLLIASTLILAATFANAATFEEVATKTGATTNKAPAWIKHGAYVYRLAVPDDPNALVPLSEGLGLTCNLFDRTVQQIPLSMGLVGDDHRGAFNWDGMWPYWNRVTFRAGGDWSHLRSFMQAANEKSNTRISFHVNLTDVNIGLMAYPETQAFFKKLVDTKSIYRRDWNRTTNKRDIEPPYVPQDIESFIKKDSDRADPVADPISIFALVNYKNFWTSGLAKGMIDEFYAHLPYAPPVLYCDVLNLDGGNFNTGFPDGPLGGSKETQLEGVLAIAEYLRSKGTELGTEGDRPFLGELGTYGWLHCDPGYSKHDYSKINGAAKGARLITQHVYGNTGSFNVSPIASTPAQIEKIRTHYKQLLSGAASSRKMPGLETWHIADRSSTREAEFDVSSGMGGDPFRGDWIDLVNGFYLTGIQELYHIGKGNVRTAVYETIGNIHVSKFGVVDANGKETAFQALDCLAPTFPEWAIASVKQYGRVMMEGPLYFHFTAPVAGKYRIKLYGNKGGRDTGNINIYVNQQVQLKVLGVPFKKDNDYLEAVDLGEIVLQAGDNAISADAGAIYAKWSDGTEAIWETPSIGKGFKVTNGDLTFAVDYDRMWPDTWSGQKKIYFFSWDGTNRKWMLPQDWAAVKTSTLYALAPEGRGKGLPVTVQERAATFKLLPQVPYVLVPAGR